MRAQPGEAALALQHALPRVDHIGGAAYADSALYTGVCWAPVEDEYGFDGMLAWEVRRPYPLMVMAVSAFLHTQDR